MSEIESEVEVPVVSDVSLEMAAIGDVFLVGVDRELPDDYREVDGEVLSAHFYPEFVSAMGIADPTFTLPEPQRMREGVRYIIKVGARRQDSVPDPALQARRDAHRKRIEEQLERRPKPPEVIPPQQEMVQARPPQDRTP
jgi:hypothetical protein